MVFVMDATLIELGYALQEKYWIEFRTQKYSPFFIADCLLIPDEENETTAEAIQRGRKILNDTRRFYEFGQILEAYQ